MDKVTELKDVCAKVQNQTTFLAMATDELNDAMLQLQHRLRSITERAPPCLELMIRVDEDARMFDRITLIASVVKKSKNHMKLFAARMRSIDRDLARFDSSVLMEQRDDTGDADDDDYNNNDDDDENESGRCNSDVDLLIDVDGEDIAEG